MILHIFVAEKFVQSFINFANEELKEHEHYFYVHNKKSKFKFVPQENLEVVKKVNFFKLLSLYRKADKVVLHGLFRHSFLLLLALNIRSISKCYWMIWGGDLYNKYFDRKKSLSNRIWNHVRKFVISRLQNFVTYLDDDYAFAKEKYDANGQIRECLLYTSNVFHQIPTIRNGPTQDKINIIIGNSATATNRHEDAFKKLLPYKGKIKLFVPLSYGNTAYAAKIISLGEKLFQEDFIPLKDFLPLEEYYKILNSIDIAVFNNDRQQGMGNLIQLLGLGKKVYIDPKTPQWTLFTKLGVEVFDVNKIDLEIPKMDENTSKIKSYFSRQNLIQQWKKILSL